MKYRLLSHNKNLVVLHGRPHEKSSLFDMVEMYSLSEQFQNDETRKKYLSKNKWHDFDEHEILIQEGIAYIITEEKNKTIH